MLVSRRAPTRRLYLQQEQHIVRSNCLLKLTFEFHSDVETLLEPAVGTPLPLRLVDDTAPVGDARVDLLVLHGPLEEPLAAFTRQEAVVVAADLVPADGAELLEALLRVGLIGLTDDAAVPRVAPASAAAAATAVAVVVVADHVAAGGRLRRGDCRTCGRG